VRVDWEIPTPLRSRLEALLSVDAND
jgi:hypothetical protein